MYTDKKKLHRVYIFFIFLLRNIKKLFYFNYIKFEKKVQITRACINARRGEQLPLMTLGLLLIAEGPSSPSILYTFVPQSLFLKIK